MNSYLADTTLLIEYFRGNSNAKEFLQQYHPSIATVTIAELIQGARDKEELTTIIKIGKKLSQQMLDKKISQKAITLLFEFHLSHGLLFLDALVAATALEYKLTLVTDNVKHFRFIKDLEVLPQEKAFTLSL